MIYLASRSPRRAEILRQLAVPFEVILADVDETPLPLEQALDYVQRVALLKAEAGWAAMLAQGLPQRPVLAADTTVSWQGQILAKPIDEADACRMLSSLSGAWHEVHTALALRYGEQLLTALSSTRVLMKTLSAAEIAAYVASKEPMDKAGGYGIQGLASLFVQQIQGSYSGVMGLPIFELGQLLSPFGLSPLQVGLSPLK